MESGAVIQCLDMYDNVVVDITRARKTTNKKLKAINNRMGPGILINIHINSLFCVITINSQQTSQHVADG
jgi:hypothetical protein